MIYRINKGCRYFPCHDALQDCTFCYCPFYPCKDSRLGGYVSTNGHRKIWSCKDCNWIHTKKVVDNIFNLIQGEKFKVFDIASKSKLKKTGIIILGHGSRRKQANDTIREAIREIKRKNGFRIIEPAYLQLCRPSLSDSVKKVVSKGCAKIAIMPFFLFVGNHVSKDIPRAIAKEKLRHKDVQFFYGRNLASDSRIVDIVMDCIQGLLMEDVEGAEDIRPKKDRR